MAEHFALQLIMRSELLAFVDLAVESDEPRDQCASSICSIRGLLVVNQLALFPSDYYALELGLKVALRRWIGQLASKRTVQVINGAEVVAILARDDGKLVMGVSGVGV